MHGEVSRAAQAPHASHESPSGWAYTPPRRAHSQSCRWCLQNTQRTPLRDISSTGGSAKVFWRGGLGRHQTTTITDCVIPLKRTKWKLRCRKTVGREIQKLNSNKSLMLYGFIHAIDMYWGLCGVGIDLFFFVFFSDTFLWFSSNAKLL